MSVFSNVGGLRPSLNFFNLSYRKKFNCDMGQLIPVMCDEVIPGDVFKVGNEMVIRFEPMVAPIMDAVKAKVRYFFVPYRLCTKGKLVDNTEYDFDWENFLSQGSDGLDASEVLPRWYPDNNAKYSLWDYMSFPTGVMPSGCFPLDFPRFAYNFVYNEYFRNETVQEEVSLFNEDILNVNWERDYFTSALLQQQRGIAPVMSGDILYLGDDDVYHTANISSIFMQNNDIQAGDITGLAVSNPRSTSFPAALVRTEPAPTFMQVPLYFTQPKAGLLTGDKPKNELSPLVYGGFNISQLRLCVQAQKWLERSNRGGNRYTELLRAHYGVAPRDERLDRPEYIGGSTSPIIISEVLQTSGTTDTSPQGNMSGHGMSVDRNYVSKYRVKEFGLIIGIMYIVPESGYMSQGINRQWLRRDRFDFAWPEFMHLSEQGIETAELYATDNEADNKDIFGYIGAYDEMRHKQDQVVADFREDYAYWTLNRSFANKPVLNSDFVKCVPDKRIFAVENYPCIKVNFRNVIHAYRPLPIIAEPGLVDHF